MTENSLELDLRPMNADDAALFAAWEAAERPYAWSPQIFREALLHGCPTSVLVFASPSRALGYAAVHRAAEEAYLSNLMVAPTERRRGIAGRLLQKVMIWAKARGATEMILDVDPANVAAVSLYNKIGFEIIERRPHSYPRGEDAIIMRKNL